MFGAGLKRTAAQAVAQTLPSARPCCRTFAARASDGLPGRSSWGVPPAGAAAAPSSPLRAGAGYGSSALASSPPRSTSPSRGRVGGEAAPSVSFSTESKPEMEGQWWNAVAEPPAAVHTQTPALPARTVPDEVLRFTQHTYFSAARHSPSIPEQHRLGEYKVVLHVNMSDLGLSEHEVQRMAVLVGPRYNWKTGEVKLVAEKFPNRIENKRYLIFLLENLLLEARL